MTTQKCPKCGCNKSGEIYESNYVRCYVCVNCNCSWTDWQQAEIKELTADKYRLVKDIADFKTEIFMIYHKLSELLYPPEDEETNV
jgi:hypothetical protein